MTHAIEIIDVTKRYGDLQALAGVSLSVEPGEFFGLLGPNGAGKTTLISILAGLSRASSGVARIMGHDVTDGYRGARGVEMPFSYGEGNGGDGFDPEHGYFTR